MDIFSGALLIAAPHYAARIHLLPYTMYDKNQMVYVRWFVIHDGLVTIPSLEACPRYNKMQHHLHLYSSASP